MRDGLGRVQSVLVLGGGSDIALETVQALVREGTERVMLAARRPAQLESVADELRRLGPCQVECLEFDAAALDSHEAFVEEISRRNGDIDVVLVAFGVLGPVDEQQRERAAALGVLTTNLLGAVSIIALLAARLESQGHGALVVLSSLAGQRARPSNFLYGASKAGLDLFCEGLGAMLAHSGVQVLIVRLGWVATKMTRGRRRPAVGATTPAAVAAAILKGLRTRADIVWVPPVTRPVAAVLRALPLSIVRRLPY